MFICAGRSLSPEPTILPLPEQAAVAKDKRLLLPVLMRDTRAHWHYAPKGLCLTVHNATLNMRVAVLTIHLMPANETIHHERKR